MSKTGIPCYRSGGCGPYEMYSCNECPASKSDYLQRDIKDYPPYLDYPKPRKPMTNYDQIVNKTPEELAEWLADILNHCENKKPEELCRMSCPLYKCCNYQPSDNIEDWLKAPVEDGA